MPHDEQMEGAEFRENFVSTQKSTKSKLAVQSFVHASFDFVHFFGTTNFVSGYEAVYLLVTSCSTEVFKDRGYAKLGFSPSFEFFVFSKQK